MKEDVFIREYFSDLFKQREEGTKIVDVDASDRAVENVDYYLDLGEI